MMTAFHFLESLASVMAFAGPVIVRSDADAGNNGSILIGRSEDFELTGDGSGKNWEKAGWVGIPNRTGAPDEYQTRAKMLYSATGIYVLFSCEDRRLTCTMNADLLDLWNEDVVEVFLWPDERRPAYFEYELSPLNFELPICLYNEDRKQLNLWTAFHYEGDRKTRHATAAQGGEKKSGAAVTGWTAECFIPFKLLQLLGPPPKSGDRWRGNLCRIDYDSGETHFSWRATNKDFHEYQKFGILIFE